MRQPNDGLFGKKVQENVFEHFKIVDNPRQRKSRQNSKAFDTPKDGSPVKTRFVHHQVNNLQEMIRSKILNSKKPEIKRSANANKYYQNHSYKQSSQDSLLRGIEEYLNTLISEDLEELGRDQETTTMSSTKPETTTRELRRGRQDSSFEDTENSTSDPSISFLTGNIALLDKLRKFRTRKLMERDSQNYPPHLFKKGKKFPPKFAIPSDSALAGIADAIEKSEEGDDDDDDMENDTMTSQRFPPDSPDSPLTVSSLPRELKLKLLRDILLSLM